MPVVFPINAYIFEEENCLTVIDIGKKSFMSEIQKLSEKTMKPVTNLLLTHWHSDHTAGVDEFHSTFPGAEIWISERDGRLLAGDFTVSAEEKLPIKGGLVKLDYHPESFLAEGMKIGSLEVIATPGHTPGHLAFYDCMNSQVLIAGDALQTRGGLAVAGNGSWTFPFVNFGTWDRARSVSSAQKLAALNVSYLATGHGKVVTHPDLSKAVKKAQERL
jgi:glyoxylase-like metal-dependent hydrolase (beta-lactamase superfamily II)